MYVFLNKLLGHEATTLVVYENEYVNSLQAACKEWRAVTRCPSRAPS